MMCEHMDAYFSLVKLTRIGWKTVTTWQIEAILVSVVLLHCVCKTWEINELCERIYCTNTCTRSWNISRA